MIMDRKWKSLKVAQQPGEPRVRKYSMAGLDKNTDGGFIRFSRYLLRHPLLTSNDKVVLMHLMSGAPFSELEACVKAKSSVSLYHIGRWTGLTRPTVTKSIAHLIDLGLISRLSRKGKGREDRFVLNPGPWPRLGDTPKELEDWFVKAGFFPVETARQWETFVQDREITTENFDTRLEEFKRSKAMLDIPKKRPKSNPLDVPKSKRNRSAQQMEGRFDDKDFDTKASKTTDSDDSSFAAKGRFVTEDLAPISEKTMRNTVSENQEIPLESGFSAQGLARARGLYIHSRYNRFTSSLHESGVPAGAVTPASAPAGAGANAHTVWSQGSASGNPTPLAALRLGALDHPGQVTDSPAGAVEPLGACEKKHKDVLVAEGRDRQTRLETALDNLPKPKYLTKSTAKTVQNHYLELAKGWGVVLPPFTRKQLAQVNTAINRYGADRLLALLDWLFKNWASVRKIERGFYDMDDYPPLKTFTAAALVDPVIGKVDRGEDLPAPELINPNGSKGFDWNAFTANQLRQREAELDAGDVILREHLAKRGLTFGQGGTPRL